MSSSNDWLDALQEPAYRYAVRKSVWPSDMPGVGGRILAIRSDWRGEGFYSLVDRATGFLPPTANLWAWILRLRFKPNTVRSYMQSLAALLVSVDYLSIDLDARFASLDVLRRREVDQIINALAWKKQRGELSRARPSTFAHRLTTAISYLRFGYDRYIEKIRDPNAYADAEKRLGRMLRWIQTAIPTTVRIQEATTSPSTLSGEQIAVLRLGIAPETPQNPFSARCSFAIQYRNAALVGLLLESGIRPAELVMLELTDLFPERRALWVSRWAPDSLDAHSNANDKCRRRRKFPRRGTVGHKTRGREIILSGVTLDVLSVYIEQFRNKLLRGRRRSPYIFLSSKDGGPLTPPGVRAVVQRIAAVFPAIGYLTSYSFRHTAVTVSSASLRKALDGVESLRRDHIIQEVLTSKFGWSPQSTMPRHYGRDDLNALLTQLASAASEMGSDTVIPFPSTPSTRRGVK